MILETMSEKKGSERLNERQRRFVQLYATNGQNGTQAARDAGYGGSDAALAVTASRMLRTAKIQQSLSQLIGKAVAKAERRAIADLAEVMEYQTRVMRTKTAEFFDDEGQIDMERVKAAPEGLVRKIRMHSVTQRFGRDGENETTNTTHEIETESALAASQALLRHYDGLDKPKDPAPTINILAILGQLSTGTLRELKATVVKAIPEKTGA